MLSPNGVVSFTSMPSGAGDTIFTKGVSAKVVVMEVSGPDGAGAKDVRTSFLLQSTPVHPSLQKQISCGVHT